LKDLFRAAGNIIRADINIGADGRPKGSGTVVFETSKDAQQAIGGSFLKPIPRLTLTSCQACTMASTGTGARWKSAR